MELTLEEVEYLTLKYLYDQKLQGRDVISKAEIMEYLGVGSDEQDEEFMMKINDDGIQALKTLAKHYDN